MTTGQNIKWTQADIDYIREAKANGMSDLHVSQALGVSKASVQLARRKYKITIEKPTPDYKPKFRDEKPFNNLPEHEIAELYAGRTYTDVKLRRVHHA